MKKIQLALLTCACLISVISFSTVYAGNRPGALTLTVGGGNEYLAPKRLIKDTTVGIVQLGYDFNQNWGIGVLFGAFKTKFKGSANDNRHINGDLFAIDAMYHLMPDSMFEPYVLAGAGSTGMSPTHYDVHNQGNINAALGGQMFLQKSFAFRMEARDIYTWVGGKNDVLLSGGVDVLIDMC